jgi:hypothetical protein
LNHPSVSSKAAACFIPIEIASATEINHSASKVYLAILPMDFIFGANSLKPNTVKKKERNTNGKEHQ